MIFKRLNKQEIIQKIENKKPELKKRGVKKIGLFGSYLKGTQKFRSDIDFLVTFDKITFDKRYETSKYLEEIFRKKIDLIIDKGLREELNYIKKEAEYVTI